MINVRIYCSKRHKDYETAYQVIFEVLSESGKEFAIERIYKVEILNSRHIVQEPHIVVNNQVVYAGTCPSRENMLLILRKMRLLK